MPKCEAAEQHTNTIAQEILAAEGDRITEASVMKVLGLLREGKPRQNRFGVNPEKSAYSEGGSLGVATFHRIALKERHFNARRCKHVALLLNKWRDQTLGYDKGNPDPVGATTIQINYNFRGRLHVDGNNFGPSQIRALGSYEGGQLFVECEDGDDSWHCERDLVMPSGKKSHAGTRWPGVYRGKLIDLRAEFLGFDGARQLHAATPVLSGERISLVWFSHGRRVLERMDETTRQELLEMGFRPRAASDLNAAPHRNAKSTHRRQCSQAVALQKMTMAATSSLQSSVSKPSAPAADAWLQNAARAAGAHPSYPPGFLYYARSQRDKVEAELEASGKSRRFASARLLEGWESLPKTSGEDATGEDGKTVSQRWYANLEKLEYEEAKRRRGKTGSASKGTKRQATAAEAEDEEEESEAEDGEESEFDVEGFVAHVLERFPMAVQDLELFTRVLNEFGVAQDQHARAKAFDAVRNAQQSKEDEAVARRAETIQKMSQVVIDSSSQGTQAVQGGPAASSMAEDSGSLQLSSPPAAKRARLEEAADEASSAAVAAACLPQPAGLATALASSAEQDLPEGSGAVERSPTGKQATAIAALAHLAPPSADQQEQEQEFSDFFIVPLVGVRKKERQLRLGEMTLGRDIPNDAHVQVSLPSDDRLMNWTSLKHLVLKVRQGEGGSRRQRIYATDMSTNGTTVISCGKAVKLEKGMAHELKAGDILSLGFHNTEARHFCVLEERRRPGWRAAVPAQVPPDPAPETQDQARRPSFPKASVAPEAMLATSASVTTSAPSDAPVVPPGAPGAPAGQIAPPALDAPPPAAGSRGAPSFKARAFRAPLKRQTQSDALSLEPDSSRSSKIWRRSSLCPLDLDPTQRKPLQAAVRGSSSGPSPSAACCLAAEPSALEARREEECVQAPSLSSIASAFEGSSIAQQLLTRQRSSSPATPERLSAREVAAAGLREEALPTSPSAHGVVVIEDTLSPGQVESTADPHAQGSEAALTEKAERLLEMGLAMDLSHALKVLGSANDEVDLAVTMLLSENEAHDEAEADVLKRP
eukprot:TRINITY_DN25180_c0_g1_i1.p1 TRINITY_DN25180_c0_g1~~TRINITY_DN25180_c0_g1_i1.p1  ORF type:complete len:1049 (-),score=227.39 TRINITY_DN25180_c0_g1_i1:34-3180(-)